MYRDGFFVLAYSAFALLIAMQSDAPTVRWAAVVCTVIAVAAFTWKIARGRY